MKKVLTVLLVIVLVGLGGFYIYLLNVKEEVTIRVTEKYWSGEKDFKDNDPIVSEYKVKKGDEIKAKRFNTGYKFTIKKISKNSVDIKSNNPISGQAAGINLTTKETHFVIKSGQELELTEPTMDAGAIYIFEIVE